MQRPNQPGFLLVLEGIDGAGKSTLARRLSDRLRQLGVASTISREPTEGPHGRELRRSAKAGRLPLAEELELFVKDRAEHVAKVIRPALRTAEVVILDRYYFSTAAYQGARGADPEAIIARNEEFAPVPDLVLLLDLDPQAGVGRVTNRGDSPDEFEALSYLAKVRETFLALQRPYLVKIDASRAMAEVFADCDAALLPALRAVGFRVAG
jgi:dTMP kinase